MKIVVTSAACIPYVPIGRVLLRGMVAGQRKSLNVDGFTITAIMTDAGGKVLITGELAGFVCHPRNSNITVDTVRIVADARDVLEADDNLHGNVDWKNADTVLTWWGSDNRYFPPFTFGEELFESGVSVAKSDYKILGAAIYQGSYLAIILKDDTYHAARWGKPNDTDPETWNVIASYERPNGEFPELSTWFFNRSGNEAQTVTATGVRFKATIVGMVPELTGRVEMIVQPETLASQKHSDVVAQGDTINQFIAVPWQLIPESVHHQPWSSFSGAGSRTSSRSIPIAVDYMGDVEVVALAETVETVTYAVDGSRTREEFVLNEEQSKDRIIGYSWAQSRAVWVTPIESKAFWDANNAYWIATHPDMHPSQSPWTYYDSVKTEKENSAGEIIASGIVYYDAIGDVGPVPMSYDPLTEPITDYLFWKVEADGRVTSNRQTYPIEVGVHYTSEDVTYWNNYYASWHKEVLPQFLSKYGLSKANIYAPSGIAQIKAFKESAQTSGSYSYRCQASVTVAGKTFTLVGTDDIGFSYSVDYLPTMQNSNPEPDVTKDGVRSTTTLTDRQRLLYLDLRYGLIASLNDQTLTVDIGERSIAIPVVNAAADTGDNTWSFAVDDWIGTVVDDTKMPETIIPRQNGSFAVDLNGNVFFSTVIGEAAVNVIIDTKDQVVDPTELMFVAEPAEGQLPTGDAPSFFTIAPI